MGMRELGGSRGAAAAAGAGEPVGAEAGVGLGTGGVKGTSLLLCSWLRWRPETLAELQVLDSGLSFVGTPKKKKKKARENLIFGHSSDCCLYNRQHHFPNKKHRVINELNINYFRPEKCCSKIPCSRFLVSPLPRFH